MSKYRKKPVVIEAMQWNDAEADALDAINWVTSNGCYAIRGRRVTGRNLTLLAGAYVTGLITAVAARHAWRAAWAWAYWGK